MTEIKDPESRAVLYRDIITGHLMVKKKDGTVIDLGWL